MENEQVYVLLHSDSLSQAYGSVYGVYKTRSLAESAMKNLERKYPQYKYWYEIHGVGK